MVFLRFQGVLKWNIDLKWIKNTRINLSNALWRIAMQLRKSWGLVFLFLWTWNEWCNEGCVTFSNTKIIFLVNIWCNCSYLFQYFRVIWVQKMKFSIKDFFNKYQQTLTFWRSWSCFCTAMKEMRTLAKNELNFLKRTF